MRPCCGTCGDEMEESAHAVTLGYLHRNAPTDYARAHRYTCPSCGYDIFLPFANAFQAGSPNAKDAILINPRRDASRPKLP